MSETIMAAHLRAAADLIEAPERWTASAWARAADGRRVPPASSDAVRWSAWGAVARCADVQDFAAALGALIDLDVERPSPMGADDRGCHAAAVDGLRHLADLAEARERAVSA